MTFTVVRRIVGPTFSLMPFGSRWRLCSLVLAATCAIPGSAADNPPPRGAATLNGAIVDSVPMVRSWAPGEFPTEVPADVKSGTALVRIVVDETGAITSSKVVKASLPAFGEAALAAAKQWTFSPGVDDGKYAPICLDVPFEFSRDRPAKTPMLPPERLMPRYVSKKPAALIDGPLGEYPETLLGRGLPGTVIFACHVDVDGKASAPRILRASHVDFVLPALAAFPSWRFSPTMQGEVARPTELRGEVTYSDTHMPKRAKVLEANGITGPDGNPPEDAPKLVGVAEPVFPYDLLLKGESGTASVDFSVGASGAVKDVRVHDASNPAFGAALAAAVQAWEFEPAMVNGRRIEVALQKRAEFKVPTAEMPGGAPVVRLLELARTNAIGGGRGLDEKLTPIYRVGPVKPANATEKDNVVIEFVIDRDGRARLARFVSAGHDENGWAAVTAVNQWIFKAPMRGGQPTEVKVQIPMEF